MKYYTSTTEYNCGIDLHARQMYICVMDRQGKKLVHTSVKNNDFEFFPKLVAPYRHDLTVIAKLNHYRLGLFYQRLEAHMDGNKFNANTVVATKLARAAGNSDGLTGCAKRRCPHQSRIILLGAQVASWPYPPRKRGRAYTLRRLSRNGAVP